MATTGSVIILPSIRLDSRFSPFSVYIDNSRNYRTKEFFFDSRELVSYLLNSPFSVGADSVSPPENVLFLGLFDKGKPAARLGRKAMGLFIEIARLPLSR